MSTLPRVKDEVGFRAGAFHRRMRQATQAKAGRGRLEEPPKTGRAQLRVDDLTWKNVLLKEGIKGRERLLM